MKKSVFLLALFLVLTSLLPVMAAGVDRREVLISNKWSMDNGTVYLFLEDGTCKILLKDGTEDVDQWELEGDVVTLYSDGYFLINYKLQKKSGKWQLYSGLVSLYSDGPAPADEPRPDYLAPFVPVSWKEKRQYGDNLADHLPEAFAIGDVPYTMTVTPTYSALEGRMWPGEGFTAQQLWDAVTAECEAVFGLPNHPDTFRPDILMCNGYYNEDAFVTLNYIDTDDGGCITFQIIDKYMINQF